MKELKIYFSEDSDLVEKESTMKEWRGDILVSYDDLLYLLNFITLSRINAEYNYVRNDSYAYCLQNTVVIESLNRDLIINEIQKIVKNNQIKSFSTIDLQTFYRDSFPELTNLSKWKRVY